MADTTIRFGRPTGGAFYTQAEGGSGVWNGTAYVSFANAGWASYATATPETPSGSGRYVCQFPLSSPPGYYTWRIYRQLGGSPTLGDPVIGQGGGYWDGTTFGGSASVTGNVGGNVAGSVASVVSGVDAVLPTIPPQGYGNLSGTAGSVIITQDYGGAGELSAIDVYGNGIGGATVTAFLATDYATNGRNATPKAQVTTMASGQWTTGMLLAGGENYVLLYSDRGYLPNPVTITVA